MNASAYILFGLFQFLLSQTAPVSEKNTPPAVPASNISQAANTSSAALKATSTFENAERKTTDTDDAKEFEGSALPAVDTDTAETPEEKKIESTNAEKPASVRTFDPVLLDIERQLRLLIRAELPEDADAQLLFDVPLDNVNALARRSDALREEQKVLSASRLEKKNRISNVETEIPKIEIPKELQRSPEKPQAPDEPTPPTAPGVKKPRGKLTAKRSEKWRAAYEEWEAYAQQKEAYDDKVTAYEVAFKVYVTETVSYEEAAAEYETAMAAHRKKVDARSRKVAALKKELAADLANIRVRQSIISLRLKYITELHRWLGPLTAPARAALVSLKQKRVSLIDTIEATKRLDREIQRLNERLDDVANRAAAGSMIGFQQQLSQAAADIQLLEDALETRGARVRTELEALSQLRISLRTQGKAVRHLIFANVFHPARDERVDEAFLSYLKEMRQVSKSYFFQSSEQKSVSFLSKEMSKGVTEPEKIGSIKDIQTLLSTLKPLVEKLDAQIDELGLSREHQKQIFRREAVSVLSNLATDATRNQAYSFSQEILSDITSDALSLKETLVSWVSHRKASIRQVKKMVSTRDGVIALVRLLAAISLLILTGLLGRKLSRFVAMGTKRFSRSKLFRHRLGQLVRWAGVVEAVLPTLLVAAALYLAMALVGFHYPEIQFVEVVVRWLVLYKFGGRALGGLTKRVSRGRPAFIQLSPDVAELLAGTYRKLGLVMALAAVVLEWTTQWFGSGILGSIIGWGLWGWLAIWTLWALVTWRQVVGAALQRRYVPDSTAKRWSNVVQRMHDIGGWIAGRRLGMLLSAPAILLLVLDSLYRKIRFLLYEGGIMAFFRARMIRRLAGTKNKEKAGTPSVLPDAYLQEFPLYPIFDEENAVILPRQKNVDVMLSQIDKWRVSKLDSSLVMIGEKGVGKTTLLSLLEQQLSGKVIRHSIRQKLKSEKALSAELGELLGMADSPKVVGAIAGYLNDGEERVILLDEAHNVFLRTIDGYDAYEALIRLVNVTSQYVFWVLVFNSFSFSFLNASKQRVHYFRKLHHLPSWTRDELFELISKRNKHSGFEIEFDEVLLDASRSTTGDFEVIEGAEGFFRLLWENSAGNPRVATCLWLDALTISAENKIKVGIFSETLATDISKMDRELLYTLAAVCQHENLSVAELRDVLNVSSDFANFAVRFLTEYGLLEPKHTDTRRHTLAPRFYPQVLKMLRGHHLLFEKE